MSWKGIPRSKAEIMAQERYEKRQKKVMVRFDENTDAELIEKLKSVESMQAYIKGLIRKDIQE